MEAQSVKGKRGFASMDPEKRRAICSAGGKASHASGAGHQFTPAEARRAGQLGGQKVARDRAHMSEIGKKGGAARSKKAREERLAGREAQRESDALGHEP